MAVNQDAVDMAVDEQETRKATYDALKAKGLPVPLSLRNDFDPRPAPIRPATILK